MRWLQYNLRESHNEVVAADAEVKHWGRLLHYYRVQIEKLKQEAEKLKDSPSFGRGQTSMAHKASTSGVITNQENCAYPLVSHLSPFVDNVEAFGGTPPGKAIGKTDVSSGDIHEAMALAFIHGTTGDIGNDDGIMALASDAGYYESDGDD